MSFVCIGSCRLNCMKNGYISTDFLNINLTHSTKDVLQLLKWGLRKIIIPDDITSYIFHSGLWRGSPLILNETISKLLFNMKVLIIEICSYKSYKIDTYYCHTDILNCSPEYPNFKHVPKNIYEKVKIELDDKENLEKDIDEILSLIDNKKLIIVSHILGPNDGETIPDRKRLINDLIDICHKKNILLICPGEILNFYKSEDIIPDYNHYNEKGLEIIKEFYWKKLNCVNNLSC
jgi:hypothetical protein